MKPDELLKEDECVLAFACEDSMYGYHMIAPCYPDGTPSTTDIGACIEMTLHRILDRGGTREDVMSVLGARIRTEAEGIASDVYDIDLGYVMPCRINIPSVKPTGIRKLSHRSFLAWLKETFSVSGTTEELIRNILEYLDKSDMTAQEKTFALMDLLDAGIGLKDEDICMCSFD